MTSIKPAVVPDETIHAARGGDQAAIDRIYVTYQPALHRYLSAVAIDSASELSERAWQVVVATIDHFVGDGNSLRGWILTIGHREWVAMVSEASSVIDLAGDDPSVADHGPIDGGVSDDSAAWAQELLRQLPAQEAEMVMLRVLGGLSTDDIARLTGLTTGNVRALSHRGLNLLLELAAADDRASSADVDAGALEHHG